MYQIRDVNGWGTNDGFGQICSSNHFVILDVTCSVNLQFHNLAISPIENQSRMPTRLDLEYLHFASTTTNVHGWENREQCTFCTSVTITRSAALNAGAKSGRSFASRLYQIKPRRYHNFSGGHEEPVIANGAESTL